MRTLGTMAGDSRMFAIGLGTVVFSFGDMRSLTSAALASMLARSSGAPVIYTPASCNTRSKWKSGNRTSTGTEQPALI